MNSGQNPPWSDPQFWDARFKASDTPWDTGSASPVLARLCAEAGLGQGSPVLVPGCGLGNDVFFFAQQGCKVSAVDWSPTAIEAVRLEVLRRGFEAELLAGDFYEIPLAWHGTFDAVAEHTFFCAIDPTSRRRYVDQLARLLRPGGRFLGSLFLREHAQDAQGRYEIFTERPGPPFWSSRAEVESLFGPRFEILRLEESPHVHPKVQQREWYAHFRLKS